MELRHTAEREGRLSSFLRKELGLSAGLMNRLKWQNAILVNGVPRHTDYAVQPGDTVTVKLEGGSSYDVIVLEVGQGEDKDLPIRQH